MTSTKRAYEGLTDEEFEAIEDAILDPFGYGADTQIYAARAAKRIEEVVIPLIRKRIEAEYEQALERLRAENLHWYQKWSDLTGEFTDLESRLQSKQ